jgi:hypothetical protein
MTRSLKDRNRWPLLLIMLGNAAVFYVAVKTNTFVVGGADELFKNWRDLIPIGATFILTNVLNELVTPNSKARLVFWRWHNPLPGSQAFTKYAVDDARIDIGSLAKELGTLPTSPQEQNALWYRLYKSVADESSVAEIHRNYLFTRDYAVVSFLCLLMLGPLGFLMIHSMNTAVTYIGSLALQYILTRQAARNHGIRFVTTVLAIKSVAAPGVEGPDRRRVEAPTDRRVQDVSGS